MKQLQNNRVFFKEIIQGERIHNFSWYDYLKLLTIKIFFGKSKIACHWSSCPFHPSLNSRSIVQNACMTIKIMAFIPFKLYYGHVTLVIFIGQISQCLHCYSKFTIGPYISYSLLRNSHNAELYLEFSV